MASINIRKERPQDKSNVETTPAANVPKEMVAGEKNGTSILKTKKTTSSSSDKTMAQVSNTSALDIPKMDTITAAGRPTTSVGPRPKADLMDLDIGQETMQPVLHFTTPSTKEQPRSPVIEASSSFDQKIEALEKSGKLNTTQLEALKTIQAQVHARANPLTSVQEARQGIHTRSELEILRPAAAAPKITTGIAKKLAEQQNAFLIGEHVHKTRYHTAASLTEDFEKLSISDNKPAKSTTTDLPDTGNLRMILNKEPAATKPSTTEKSIINPFGPPPAKGKGPSLPAHLLNRATPIDHGAAARAQYSGGNDKLALVSDRQPLRDLTGPTRATRRNKINETGFIALAQDRATGKKGEDPLLVAHKRGL